MLLTVDAITANPVVVEHGENYSTIATPREGRRSVTGYAESIGRSIGKVPNSGYVLAALSALMAYVALAWYDRIALLHLNRQDEVG